MQTLLCIDRQGGKAVLTLSTGETLCMPRAMLKERPYRAGAPFDRSAFDDFMRERAYPFAMQKAVALLSVRSRSAREIRCALLSCAYPEETIARVLSRLEDAGYIDDMDFAAQYASSRAERGLGPRRVAMELRQKGLGDSEIRDAMAAFDEDAQLESALLAAKKASRGRDLTNRSDRQKVLGALSRRGFSVGVARRALELLLKET